MPKGKCSVWKPYRVVVDFLKRPKGASTTLQLFHALTPLKAVASTCTVFVATVDPCTPVFVS